MHEGLKLVLVGLAVTGCAGLMMDVKDLDAAGKGVRLRAGDEVALEAPDVAVIAEEFSKEDATRVAGLLKQEFRKRFAEAKVKVAPGADNKVRVKVTNYEQGCGFCRGFFPVFGLGDSAVDGEVELSAGGEKRRLVVQKTGQASGMAEMGDQTETNVAYFATVVVGRLTEPAKKD